jgi:hypothetical protein
MMLSRIYPLSRVLALSLAAALLAAVCTVLLVAPAVAAGAQDPAPADEKTRLEILKLRQDTGPESRIRPYVPLVSVLVAGAALGVGFMQFLREQRVAREVRAAADIDHAVDRLLSFPEREKSLSVNIVASLNSLEHVMKSSPTRDREAERVTDIIVTAVTDDLYFTNLNHAVFDPACLQHWAPYRDRVRKDPQVQDLILYKYVSALRDLAARDPVYFSTVRLNERGQYTAQKHANEADFLLFKRLIAGYAAHSGQLAKARYEGARTQLAEVLQNTGLANDLLPG